MPLSNFSIMLLINNINSKLPSDAPDPIVIKKILSFSQLDLNTSEVLDNIEYIRNLVYKMAHISEMLTSEDIPDLEKISNLKALVAILQKTIKDSKKIKEEIKKKTKKALSVMKSIKKHSSPYGESDYYIGSSSPQCMECKETMKHYSITGEKWAEPPACSICDTRFSQRSEIIHRRLIYARNRHARNGPHDTAYT